MIGPAAPFSGAVLCGGASRRMGVDKATLVVHGTPMACRVADRLWDAGAAEVYAVGGDALALGALGLRAVPDEHPGDGPFPATLTALRAADHDVVAVLSCDLLDPRSAAVERLLAALADDVAGVVPVVDGHHQWTHAVWHRRSLTPLAAAWAAGARSLRRAAAGLPLALVHDLEAGVTADADSPADLPW